MRLWLAAVCLLLVACGDDDDESGGSGAGGSSDAGEAGRSGGSGRSSNSAGWSGAGDSGQAGAGGMAPGNHAGRGGNQGASAADGGSGSGGSTPGFGTIKLVPNIVAGAHTSTSSFGVGSSQFALRVGQPSATTLLSLKYYVSGIQLCEDLELAGSGFMNAKGCIDLYRNVEPNQPDYATYMVDAARNDTNEGRYIDLMTAEGQAALRKPVTLQVPIASALSPADVDVDGGVADPPSQAGVYRFGLINFYRPIKVKAEFPIFGETGLYFRTKAVSAIHTMPGPTPGIDLDRVEIGDTLSGATEETTYMLNNGGALFVFQKPFAITQADIDAKAEIKVDLVFNPENFGQAYVSNDCANQSVAICDPMNNVVIDMPFVRMSPVPRKAGQKARKEIYLIDYEDHNQVRVELYYNDADLEASIQGVDTALVYLPDAALATMPSNNTIASNFVAQSGSVTTDDASVSLLDYRHMTNVEGLIRRHDGTLTIHCLFTGSVCPALGSTVTRAYTYVGDSLVSSD